MPQVLYRAGLSSKEGLQEHDSVDPILVVKFPRMLRGPPSALPPGRYLRSTWILREGQWHRMEDHAQVHDTPAKFDRYVERAVFQFHPVRGQLRTAAVSEVHLSPVPEHLCACPACQMAVGGCRARARHPWGYQGFTLPLRFNGRSYLRRIPYVGNTKWTTITEDVFGRTFSICGGRFNNIPILTISASIEQTTEGWSMFLNDQLMPTPPWMWKLAAQPHLPQDDLKPRQDHDSLLF